jgi:Beta-propeller repeat
MNHPKNNKKWCAAFCFGWLLLGHALVSVVHAESPDLAWVHHAYTTTGVINAYEMKVDAAGNIFAIGRYDGITYFGTNKLSSGWDDGFITKYDAAGNVLWTRAFASSNKGDDYVKTITLDAAGNCYVAGTFNLPSRIVTEKYDPAGNLLWRRILGGVDNQYDSPTGIAVDGANNIYLAGNFRGTVDFGGTSLTSTNPTPFLAKYNSSTNLLWVIQPGTANMGRLRLDGDGHIYANGWFTTSAVFGGIPLNTTAGGTGGFLAKMDLAGNVLWLRSSTESAISFNLDAQNNCYLSGSFMNTLILDTGAGTTNLTSHGWHDLFVAKYDHSGNLLWVSSAGTPDDEHLNSAAVDKTGNVYVTGEFPSTNLTFGNITLPGQPPSGNVLSLFMAKYNSSGQALWAKELKNGYRVRGMAVAIDDQQQCYLGGHFGSGFYQLGNLPLVMTNYSGNDFFITKLVDRPRLKIASTGSQSLFSWGTNWPGHVLEATTDLTGGTWSTVTNTPGLSGDQNVVTVENPAAPKFFRLRSP